MCAGKAGPAVRFPVAHLLVLFSAATGMPVDLWAQPPHTSALADTPEAPLHLDAGDVLVGDDSFSGYPHLAGLVKQGLHGLFPVHHLRIVDFRKGRPHNREGGRTPWPGGPRRGGSNRWAGPTGWSSTSSRSSGRRG